MQTSVERIDGYTVKLSVTCSAEEVDKAIDDAYKSVAKKVKIPGFRAGKAPKPIIDTHFGAEAILAEAIEGLVSDTYPQALDAEGLRPVQQPEMEELDLVKPHEEYTYDATVVVRPELTLSSIEGLEITVPPATASDREIDSQIEHMRTRYATLEPVEDRGVADDDFVLLSFKGTVDGEEYEGNVVDKYLYEMGRGLMPAEFEEGIKGLKAGDTTRIEFGVPDTSSNPDFVGKNAEFDVTIHEIKARVLPELDDEFAATAGGYDSMTDMRENIRGQLDRSKAVGATLAREREARRALAERAEGDIPEAMFESARDGLRRDFASSLETRGLSFEQYLQASGMDFETLDKDLTAQADQSVREELALEALFRKLDLEVTDTDIDATLAEIADIEDTSPEAIAQIRERWEAAGVLAAVREQIQHRKAVEWLLDDANVTVTQETEKTSDSEE